MRHLILLCLFAACGEEPYHDTYDLEPGAPTHEDPMITGAEAYWCGVGTAGAVIIGGPASAFLYAIACGMWADMDTW